MFTPWGVPEVTERLERGITYIRSSTQGGFMLSRGYAESRLSAEARAIAARFGEYYAFDRSSAWAVLWCELPHLANEIARAARVKLGSDPAHAAARLLSVYHPEYLRAAQAQHPTVLPAELT